MMPQMRQIERYATESSTNQSAGAMPTTTRPNHRRSTIKGCFKLEIGRRWTVRKKLKLDTIVSRFGWTDKLRRTHDENAVVTLMEYRATHRLSNRTICLRIVCIRMNSPNASWTVARATTPASNQPRSPAASIHFPRTLTSMSMHTLRVSQQDDRSADSQCFHPSSQVPTKLLQSVEKCSM